MLEGELKTYLHKDVNQAGGTQKELLGADRVAQNP
jgi:hypothetical protein